MSIRYDANGQVWIPRRDPVLEKQLDARFPRVAPGELRWSPIDRGRLISFDAIAARFALRRFVLVGKGPSLDVWAPKRAALDPSVVVMTLNEAALAVPNPTVCLAWDEAVVTGLAGKWPAKSLALVPSSRLVLAGAKADVEVAGFPEDGLGARISAARGLAACALVIIQYCRATELLMVGFDGLDSATSPYAAAVSREIVDETKRVVNVPDLERVNVAVREVLDQLAFPVRFAHRGEDLSAKPRVEKGG